MGKSFKEKFPKRIRFKGNLLLGLERPLTMEFDATKKPKRLDLSFVNDKKERKIFPAIYSVEGDELKLAFPVVPVGGQLIMERPESFETTGKLIAFITAKREG
jgi:uncharacterized protein (TIGR03067 family)